MSPQFMILFYGMVLGLQPKSSTFLQHVLYIFSQQTDTPCFILATLFVQVLQTSKSISQIPELSKTLAS